jgi:hypothetical protein
MTRIPVPDPVQYLIRRKFPDSDTARHKYLKSRLKRINVYASELKAKSPKELQALYRRERAKEQRLLQAQQKAIEEGLTKRREREAAPYDGVLGSPPSWVPDPLVQELRHWRTFLLDKGYSVDEIQNWRKARLEELRQGGFWIPSYPPEHTHVIDSLNYVERITSLGEVQGIKAYLGKSGERVYRGSMNSERQRTAAQAPRTDRLGRWIEDFLCKNPSATQNEVLKGLEHEQCPGMFIEEVSDNAIEWKRENGAPVLTPISGLKDRISRARKKFKSR